MCAFDAGVVLDPENLRNQIEGALVQGLGAALFEQARFDSERMLNPQYRVPRFADVPLIEVILVTPAIGNAIFRVKGRRLRSMPFEGE